MGLTFHPASEQGDQVVKLTAYCDAAYDVY